MNGIQEVAGSIPAGSTTPGHRSSRPPIAPGLRIEQGVRIPARSPTITQHPLSARQIQSPTHGKSPIHGSRAWNRIAGALLEGPADPTLESSR